MGEDAADITLISSLFDKQSSQWDGSRLKRQAGGEKVEREGLCVGSRSGAIRTAADKEPEEF